MTLPDYTLRLLEERYSPEAMRAWRQAYIASFTIDLSAFAAFGEAAQRFGEAMAALGLLRPRPVYAPSSPLTLALLKELYGGPE